MMNQNETERLRRRVKELEQQRDEFEEQRDTAWAELRRIRVAIGADMNESTADEAERIKRQRDELLARLEESNRWLIGEGIYPNQVEKNNAAIAKVKP